MEYGIITRSESGLKKTCQKYQLDPDNVYVISNSADLRFAKEEVGAEGQLIFIILADDWRDTGITRAAIRDEVVL